MTITFPVYEINFYGTGEAGVVRYDDLDDPGTVVFEGPNNEAARKQAKLAAAVR